MHTLTPTQLKKLQGNAKLLNLYLDVLAAKTYVLNVIAEKERKEKQTLAAAFQILGNQQKELTSRPDSFISEPENEEIGEGQCMLGGVYENKGKYGAKYIVRFKTIYKRFDSKREAERYLTALRFQFDRGVFDEREHKKGDLLAFETLALRYISIKRKNTKPSSARKIEEHLYRAIKYFGKMNVKQIEFVHLEDFLNNLKNEKTGKQLSSKTRGNIKSTLHAFFVWLQKSKYIKELPDFPDFKVRTNTKKILSKDLQERVLEEVYKISWEYDPKIFIGLLFLATYYAIRPDELLNIKEGDIDLPNEALIIRDPKEGKDKVVDLLPEHVHLLKGFPQGLPHLFFFRHPPKKGVQAGRKYGGKYLYKWWRKACENLGIRDVDLYRGTKSTTITALKEHHSPEQIKYAGMIKTDKAFNAYFRVDRKDLLKVYQSAKPNLNIPIK